MDILLIEDDSNIGNSLTKGLSEEGYTTTWVKNGLDAREVIFNKKWDIIISYCIMI